MNEKITDEDYSCENTKGKNNINYNAEMKYGGNSNEKINYEIVLNALENYYYILIMNMTKADINEEFLYENKNKVIEVLKQIINVSKILNLNTKKYEIELNKIEK